VHTSLTSVTVPLNDLDQQEQYPSSNAAVGSGDLTDYSDTDSHFSRSTRSESHRSLNVSSSPGYYPLPNPVLVPPLPSNPGLASQPGSQRDSGLNVPADRENRKSSAGSFFTRTLRLSTSNRKSKNLDAGAHLDDSRSDIAHSPGESSAVPAHLQYGSERVTTKVQSELCIRDPRH
jgi:hypothetical protein